VTPLLLLCALLLAPLDDDLLDRAAALRKQGKLPQAAALLEADRAGGEPSAERDGLLGQLLLDMGRAPEAETLVAPWAEAGTDSYRCHVLLARLSERRRDDQAAVKSWRRAVKLKAEPVEALMGQASTLLRLGKPSGAVKAAETLAALRPELGNPLLARALIAQGDRTRAADSEQLHVALHLYGKALDATPDDLEVLEHLLDALLMGARIDDAAALVETHLATEDRALRRQFWTGRCAEAGRDHVRARAAFLAVLEADGSQAEAALRLARLELRDGNLEQARSWLAQGREQFGDSTRVLNLTAEIHLGLREPELAEAALRRVLVLSPRDSGAAYQLARALYAQGKRDAGDAAMERFREMQTAARAAVTGEDEQDG
jgi:tetratricopeptide (TPR) repeat protein